MQEELTNYGFLSVLPPVIAIIIAIWRRQVFPSLLFGIWLGYLIIHNGNLLDGTMATISGLVDVFKDAGNTRTIMFSALVGSLILLVQKSGGVSGFVHWVDNRLKNIDHGGTNKSRVLVQLAAWLTGMIIFVETSIIALTVGTIFRPIFDKMKIPREKLAYIADSTAAPIAILIPFNAWGAFIMGLLVVEGFDNPFSTMFKAMAFNFYPMLALLLVPILIITGWDFGPMAKAEKRAKDSGKVLADNAKPMVSNELTKVEPIPGIPLRAINMLLPIMTMVLMMPVMLSYTGWEQAVAELGSSNFIKTAFFAIGKGSGSTAVLTSVLTALLVSFILYRAQKIMRFDALIESTLKGVSELMPLALLMMLAFAISGVCRELHTGIYVAGVAKNLISPSLIPVIIFGISSFIAFATGTSWGTFAIMIPIAVPMAQNLDVNVYLAIAAALSGGVFGDHSSPISDTTIISSMASASDHIDHVKTQLPYAMTAGALAAGLFLTLGLIMH